MKRPIVICGSQRFKDPLEGFIKVLENKGVIIFAPDFKYHRKKSIHQTEEKRLESDTYRMKVPGLVRDHFDNLEQAKSWLGLCLIFNPLSKDGRKQKYGYIGFNTSLEIGYAAALKMPIFMLRPHNEECVMTAVHKKEPKRIFTVDNPGSDPLDFEKVWDWLKRFVE